MEIIWEKPLSPLRLGRGVCRTLILDCQERTKAGSDNMVGAGLNIAKKPEVSGPETGPPTLGLQSTVTHRRYRRYRRHRRYRRRGPRDRRDLPLRLLWN